jgi:hypothetical protein
MSVTAYSPPVLRLRATWHAKMLDDELAYGVEPWTSPLLALRARKLTSAHSRKRIANALMQAVRSARRPTPGLTAAMHPDSEEVLAAADMLDALNRRLRDPRPVRAQGLVMLRELLTDATSPLYQPVEAGALGGELLAAAAALEPVDSGH